MSKNSRIMKILIAVLLMINIVLPVRVLADDDDPVDDQYVETGNGQTSADPENPAEGENPVEGEKAVEEGDVVQDENDVEENKEEEIIFSTGYISSDFRNTDNLIVQRNRLRKSGYSQNEQLPSEYTTHLTPIKNQGNYGNCWAFAVMASAESTYYNQTGKDIDLSELHLAYYAYHTLGAKDPLDLITNDGFTLVGEDSDLFQTGGNSSISIYILSSGVGYAYESDLPYSALDGGHYTLERFKKEILPEDDSRNCYGTTDYYLIEADCFSPKDTQTIKEAIYHNGAVAISYYAIGTLKSNKYYNADEAAYYCYDDLVGNHAVTVVGYDDNYPKENFIGNKTIDDPDLKLPEKDGAFLVRNSWDTVYGKDGYFWMSYEDKSFYTGDVVQYYIEKADDLHIYQYDGTAAVYSYTYDSDTAKTANVFVAQNDEQIRKVGYWTDFSDVLCTISIYRNVEDTPESGTLVKSFTSREAYGGYHTFSLDEVINIGKDEKFSIVVEKQNMNGQNITEYLTGTAVDDSRYWYRAYDQVAEGQSFIYENNGWNDLCGFNGNSWTASVKAYCQNTPEEDKRYDYQGGSIIQEFDQDAPAPLSFTFKRKVLDDLSFRRFKCAYVDEKPIKENTDFSISSGSLNILLKKSYLETLSVGKHVLKVEFEDGLSASAEFKVLPKSEPKKPSTYVLPLTGIE